MVGISDVFMSECVLDCVSDVCMSERVFDYMSDVCMSETCVRLCVGNMC